MLRKTLAAAYIGLCFTACGIHTGKVAEAGVERKGRIIRLTDDFFTAGGTDTVRFGRMHSGETAVVQFWLENATQRPAVVTSYDRTCGCTTLEFDSQPIAPGDRQRMQLLFDSRGERGWQLKVVNLNIAGAQSPLRLFVEAEVE